MAYERELKFLVTNTSFKNHANESYQIRQGYLNRNPERTVRIRTKKETSSGICSAFLTVKGKNAGDTRLEFEYPIPYDDALEMIPLCEPGIIVKTRWLVASDCGVWEIDEFHGNLEGLVLAEIENPSQEIYNSLPDFIGKEVTGDSRYYNSVLCNPAISFFPKP